MTTITGLTAARMAEIEDACIVSGAVVVDNLILTTHGGDDIDAGSVRGPAGPAGSGFTICTSTTRPTGLGTGDAGIAIYETDTKLRYYWDGVHWRVQERIARTSTTRPTLTVNDAGAVLYETDTGYEYVWSGTSWISSVGSWPAGLVIPSFYATADDGFALLVGGTLSRTGLGARLFSKWGTLFGPGNGTSTFSLPDFQGYTLAGVGGAISGALGSKSGAVTHTLTTAQIPSHQHAIPTMTAGAAGGFELNGTNNVGFALTGATGGGGSHPNVQPTALCNWQVSL